MLETTAEVMRGGKWQLLPSPMLVPGDVIRIASNWLLPCDCVIIQGTEVSMLSSIRLELTMAALFVWLMASWHLLSSFSMSLV